LLSIAGLPILSQRLIAYFRSNSIYQFPKRCPHANVILGLARDQNLDDFRFQRRASGSGPFGYNSLISYFGIS